MKEKTNIIYIHSHDTGRYISPYGHGFKTPNIQTLAEQGVLFKQNFCINPSCSPSRAALLTGSYPHQNGMLGLAHRGFSLHDYREHLLHTLKAEGYHSALAGIQHITDWGGKEGRKDWEVIGYDEYLGGMDIAHDAACDFINNAEKEKPFFLAVGFFETHREFPELDAEICDPRYVKPPMPLPDKPEVREDMARYGVSAKILDDKVGQILEALDQNDLAENTLVICTTDHGLAFPHMKCNLTDDGLETFLIMRGPEGFKGGKVVDAMTSHMDIFPTICEMLDIDKPARLEGKSLLPLVKGNENKIHDELYFQVNYHASVEPMRAVRTERFKYIKYFTGHNQLVLPNCDDSETKDYLLAADWQNTTVATEQLYDLLIDPAERNNLTESGQHQSVLNDMRGLLDSWMIEKSDPLANGSHLSPPEGAVVNPLHQISPCEEPLVPA